MLVLIIVVLFIAACMFVKAAGTQDAGKRQDAIYMAPADWDALWRNRA